MNPDFTAPLSRRRTELMGVAAILVICAHSYADLPLWLWRRTVMAPYNVCVDVFMLLAGFGCAHSLKKNPGLGAYFGRRLARLLPPYYIALPLFFLTGGLPSFESLAAHVFIISAWVGHPSTYWYIAATLVFYLLIPPMDAVIRRAPHPRLAVGGLLTLIVPLLFATRHSGLEAALARLPALIVGTALGALSQTRRDRREWFVDTAALLALYAAGFALLRRPDLPDALPVRPITRAQALYLQRSLRAPLIAVALAAALDRVEGTPLRWINAPLRRAGELSLELYLSHAVVRQVGRDWLGLTGLGLLAFMLALSGPLAAAVARGAKGLRTLAERLARRWRGAHC